MRHRENLISLAFAFLAWVCSLSYFMIISKFVIFTATKRTHKQTVNCGIKSEKNREHDCSLSISFFR